MAKEVGYFLDPEAQKKVKKARALDESLLGKNINKQKSDETFDRVFGKKKKRNICSNCGKETTRSVITVEKNKTILRCYHCNDNRKS